jgi:hypothetical protein
MSIPEALDNVRTPKSPSKSLLTMEDALARALAYFVG